MTTKFTRRWFMQRTGLGAAAIPFLPGLKGYAQSVAQKRIIFFVTPGSFDLNNFVPAETGSNFTFGSVSQPLEAHKKDILMLSNLRLKAADLGNADQDGHRRAAALLLTGYPTVGTNRSGGISIDQHIGQVVSNGLPHRSLNFGIANKSSTYDQWLFGQGGSPIPTSDNPAENYKKLSGFFSAGSGTPQPLAANLVRRRAVLAQNARELKRLEAELVGDDRQMMQAHLARVEDIQKQIDLLEKNGGGGSKVCAPFDVPNVGSIPNQDSGVKVPLVSKLQMDIMLSALHCGITGVATLIWASAATNVQYGFPEVNVQASLHAMTHNQGDQPKLEKVNNWHAKQFIYLVEGLKTRGLFENTLVVWANEMGAGIGNHGPGGYWVVLAGSLGGTFKTGRNLKYKGESMNDLWASVATAMGVPTQKFGHEGAATGQLSGLTTA